MFIESIFGQFWWPSCLTSKLTSICVNLIMTKFFFFVNLLHSPDVWLFDIWHLLENLTSFWHLDIFLIFWVEIAHGSHCPFAHIPVPHCPCTPLPMWPIADVAHSPCTPYPLCPITHVPHTPCAPIANRPHGLYPLYPIPPVHYCPIFLGGLSLHLNHLIG